MLHEWTLNLSFKFAWIYWNFQTKLAGHRENIIWHVNVHPCAKFEVIWTMLGELMVHTSSWMGCWACISTLDFESGLLDKWLFLHIYYFSWIEIYGHTNAIRELMYACQRFWGTWSTYLIPQLWECIGRERLFIHIYYFPWIVPDTQNL